MALSLLLLVGAGLFVRTLQNLQNQGPGFPTDHLLTFALDPSLNGYSSEQTALFYARLDETLGAMPGVSSVGLSSMPLLKGYAWQNAVIGENSSGAAQPDQAYFPYSQGASFRFMNVYLRTGDLRALERQIQERMRQSDPHVPSAGPAR